MKKIVKKRRRKYYPAYTLNRRHYLHRKKSSPHVYHQLTKIKINQNENVPQRNATFFYSFPKKN
jgi:hypothetical protein